MSSLDHILDAVVRLAEQRCNDLKPKDGPSEQSRVYFDTHVSRWMQGTKGGYSREELVARWNAFFFDKLEQYQVLHRYARNAFTDYRCRTAIHVLAKHGYDWGHPLPGIPRYYHPDVLSDMQAMLVQASQALRQWEQSAYPGRVHQWG